MEGFEQTRARWFLGGCFVVLLIPFFIGGAILTCVGLMFTAFSAGVAGML